jgi:uncharacterized protein YecT (DUF1311 family)
MLRKTIYSMPIIILTIGAASAQTDMELRDIKGGQTSFRTQQEKKNDRDIDRAYESAMKRVPNAEKRNLIRGPIPGQLHQWQARTSNYG